MAENCFAIVVGEKKLGFINGEDARPKLDNATYRQSERCDNILTSWISLSMEIADRIEYFTDHAKL